MGRYNFKFGNIWLSEFGGVCTEEPPIEIAQRDITLIDIPGKDGSDCIDNGRYNNVEFTRTIALVGKRISSAKEKTIQLINSFAYLQGYQPFEDTDHEGMVTEAVLLNLEEVIKNLRTMYTATLKFSRKPYWTLKSSLEEMPLDNTEVSGNGVEIYNPYPTTACPIIRFHLKTDPHSTLATVKIKMSISSNYGGVYSTKDYSNFGINFLYTHNILDFDIENQRVVVHSPSGELYKYADALVPKPIGPGATKIQAEINKDIDYISIIPKWRCL